jgi:hypothetical protein
VLDDDDVSHVILFIRSLDASRPHNGAGGEAPTSVTSGPALGLAGAATTPAAAAEGVPR